MDYVGQVAAYAEALQEAGAVSAYEESEAAEQASSCLSQLRARLVSRLSSTDQSAAARAAPLRTLHHLVCLLELHSRGNPSAADADAANDLERICTVAAGGGGEPGQEESPHWMDTLVDVLLSLLAHSHAPLPSAPLRDAAERAFRAFSEQLTATGLADLLRIIVQPLEGAGEEQSVFEGDSGDEDEGSDSADDSGSDDGSEEEEQGGSDNDSDEEIVRQWLLSWRLLSRC